MSGPAAAALPLALIVVTTVLAHAAYNGSRLTVSLSALSLGGSALTVGVMMSLYAALPMVLSVNTGRLVDRIGVRAPMIVAAALLALSVMLPGLVPGLGSLYASAAGSGLAFMLFQISVQHAIGAGSSLQDRKDNFGWLALAFSISNFLGPTLAGVSIDTFGHRATFLVLSLLALVSLLLLASRRAAFTHTPHAPARQGQGGALELLRDPELRRIFLVTGLLASAWDLFVFVMPIHGTAIGLSASTIGLILGAFALATFLIRVVLPWIQRRVREWTMITTTMAVACLAYALFPVVDTVPLLAMIAFLLGLGLGATQPSIMTLIYATAPPGRGAEAIGVRSVVLSTSHTALPLAFGGVGAALGLMPVFWAMSAALAAGGVLANRHRLGAAKG